MGFVSYGYGAIAGLHGMEMTAGTFGRVTFDAKPVLIVII